MFLVAAVLITPHEWFKAGPRIDPPPDQSMAKIDERIARLARQLREQRRIPDAI